MLVTHQITLQIKLFSSSIFKFVHIRNLSKQTVKPCNKPTVTPLYLTTDSRSTSSPRPKDSSCLDVLTSQFDTDRAFFLLSTFDNQSSSSSSSSLFWLLETSGLVCLVILSVGAWVSDAILAADMVWLPVREGLLSEAGEEGAFGDSVAGLVSLASKSRKVWLSSVLRPNQSAEFRCRRVEGLGFFSGELMSSVENLMIKKYCQF